jgi:hypothetical protein
MNMRCVSAVVCFCCSVVFCRAVQVLREAGAEEMFRELAMFTARTVRHAAVHAAVQTLGS